MKTVLFLLLLSPLTLRAQGIKITPEDTGRKHSFLLMRDGSLVKGQIIRQDSTVITVRKTNGDMTFVEADQLLRITPARPDQPTVANASEGTGRYAVFVLKDSSRVEGKFVRRDSTMITVRKRNGQLTYFEPELLTRVDSMQSELASAAMAVFPNRFSPWLLTGLTAQTAEKGRFYYRNTWLLLNEFDYGITRFWSVGASFIAPVPYVVYTDTYYGSGQYVQTNSRLFMKVSVPLGPNFRVGVNASYQANQRYSYMATKGVVTLQALATIGNSQRNVTVSYGIALPKAKLYYFNPTSSSFPSPPIYVSAPHQTFLSLGIMQKVARGLTLLSDNRINLGSSYYFYDSERLTASVALRLDRRRHAFDLGVYGFIYERPRLYDTKSARIFPYLGYNLIIGPN